MKNQWILRGLALSILWVGLGILTIEEKATQQILWQGVIFSFLVLIGIVVEKFLDYQGEKYLFPCVLAILVLGLVFLTRINPDSALKQFYYANIALAVYYGMLWGIGDYRKLGRYQYLWGLCALILLMITLLFGVTSGGATSWLKIGGFTFESEELVKVAVLLFLSAYLTEREELLRVGTVQLGRLSLPDWRTLGPFLVMAGFAFVLLAAQKSLGTALVFYSMFVLMLYVATERPLYLGISLPIFLLTGWLGYMVFDHVKVRIWTWINPWLDTAGGGYQIAQSLFAISGGKLFGTGLGNGIGAFQIPASSTDFIFPVIAEEIGFAGAMGLLTLFLIVILRAFAISLKAVDRFGQLLAAGIGILIGTEALIILAGVTKLLPLTGIPLPFVSRGGSSLIVHFLLLGILTNISHATGVNAQKGLAKGKECAG